jgi:hypothetical protein
MLEPFERQTLNFVVRLWLEPADEGSPRWRGQIEHVGSGQRVHFQAGAGIADLLLSHLGELGVAALGRPDGLEPEQGGDHDDR